MSSTTASAEVFGAQAVEQDRDAKHSVLDDLLKVRTDVQCQQAVGDELEQDRPNGSSPASSSRTPPVTVTLLTPAARATAATPPWPITCA